MWDAITKLVNGPNGTILILFIILVIINVIQGIRKGYISFMGHGLNINAAENEAKIRRQQSEYLNMIADGTIRDLPKNFQEGNSYYRSKYVISKFKDIFEMAIMYNHITDDEEYITLKQETAYSMIMKVTEDDYFRSPEFKKYLDDLVEKIIKRFVKIRKAYSEK